MPEEKSSWFCAWRVRHQTPLSFWLHVIGIPLTIAGVLLGIWQLTEQLWELWWRPCGLFVLGYFLQWIGHRHEGNDMGEVICVKKLLGMPYVAVSPRFETKSAVGSA